MEDPPTRAADRDRDAALERLSQAAGDGQLTLEEYSARADLALRAKVLGELSELTGDLQGPTTAAPAQHPERLRAILSNESRKGRWRVPGWLAARSVLGDVHLELQEALLTAPVTRIDAHATLGSITIFVPEGVDVRMSGTSLLGSTSCRLTADPIPGGPVIEVRARAVLGNVTVRPAKLSQRLRSALTAALDSGESPHRA
ncbi:MAG TPA: DUF1707 domain-containing protein [Solirubrobacteraceae bacterium]|nr:DUF1707 domain-containing protein [Solirubrobacteraceae bacterium]